MQKRSQTRHWHPSVLTNGILPDEPLHGLYLRLSDLNGFERSHQFWTSTSVLVSRCRFGDDLAGLERISEVDLSDLQRAAYTRQKGDLISIHGNQLKAQEAVLLKTRRLCPVCVEESAHHRFFWDLAVVTTCPKHGVKLVENCGCGGKLSWYDGRIKKCGRCEDGSIDTIVCEAADEDVIAFDCWVLGRFGLSGVRDPDILKGMSLRAALEIIERVAALDLGPYSEKWVEIHDLSISPDIARAHGYRLIAEDRVDEALDHAFERFVAANPDEQPSMLRAYGWFHLWFRQQGAEQYCLPLAEIVLANAKKKFQVVRGTFGVTDIGSETMTISDAKDQCGVSARTMRRILEHEGKIRAEKRKGSPVKVEAADVERIAQDLRETITHVGVERMIGAKRDVVQALVRSGLLPVWVPGGPNGAKHRYMFRSSDIVEWLARLATDAPRVLASQPDWISLAATPNGRNVKVEKLYKALLDGTIKAQAVLDGACGIHAIQLANSDVVPLATKRRPSV